MMINSLFARWKALVLFISLGINTMASTYPHSIPHFSYIFLGPFKLLNSYFILHKKHYFIVTTLFNKIKRGDTI